MKKVIIFFILLALFSCSKHPTPEDSYSESDHLINLISKNISKEMYLTKNLEVDHSRLANREEEPLNPTSVIMFTNKILEKKMIEKNSLLALELPFKILVYTSNDETKVIWNNIDYISERYHLSFSKDFINEYNKSFSVVTKGVPEENISSFTNKSLKDDGIITLNSPYDYKTTYKKSVEFIKENKDVIIFDTIDFQSKIKNAERNINKMTLIIFGAPKPGGKAMMKSQTLGLDAFPQKLLIWEDSNKRVYVSYNDLMEMATRQEVDRSFALRVIQYRLNKLFPKDFRVVKGNKEK